MVQVTHLLEDSSGALPEGYFRTEDNSAGLVLH